MTKKEKADIWMPLYIGDYLADTTRLTTEQHGAYLLLIMDYWRSGKLPDNDAVLMQITRLQPNAWSNARAMLEQFFSIENGFWIHSRIDKELELAQKNKDTASQKATKAAMARWNKDNATSNATSINQAMLEQCPSPSPSPSSLPSKSSSKNKSQTDVLLLKNFGIEGDLAKDFINHRKNKKASITKTVLDGFQREADKAGISIIDAVTISIERNWQSFKAEWHQNQTVTTPQQKQPAISEAEINKAARPGESRDQVYRRLMASRDK